MVWQVQAWPTVFNPQEALEEQNQLLQAILWPPNAYCGHICAHAYKIFFKDLILQRMEMDKWYQNHEQEKNE